MGIDVGSKNGKPGRAQPSMNVTPLVDVVLVLLIIFMVITPLLTKQFWLHLPSKIENAQPASPDAKPPIVVSVTANVDIRINRDIVSKAEFPNKLRRAFAATGERTVFFDADEDAAFGAAVEAMDLARGDGAATIAVLTDPLRQ